MTFKYNDDTIEQYVLGTLGDSEKAQFEDELSTNAAFRSYVKEQAEIIQAIGSVEKDELTRSAIQKAGNKYFESHRSSGTASVRKIGWTKWVAAAAAVVALVLVVNFLLSGDVFDPDAIFAENFVPGAMLEMERSVDSLDETNLWKGYLAYQQADYRSSIELFSKHFAENEQSPKDLNYAGMAALALDPPDLDAATGFFSNILSSGENIYRNSANWHLALISLKKNDQEGAKSYLEKLQVGPDHKYTERSGRLLDALK